MEGAAWLLGGLCAGLQAVHGAAAEIYTWAGNGPGCTDGTGVAARFFSPARVAKDAAGSFYISDNYGHTIRKMTALGVVTTLAGQPGASGSANGPRSVARFAFPAGLVVDTSNNVFVADTGNNAIRKITPAGVVTTVAGGTYGTNDGVGLAARFSGPYGVGLDAANNLYVADTGNSAIRKVTLGGVVTTLAGITLITGTNDGTGAAARFNRPYDLTVDSDGSIYVADSANHTIRKVTPGGAVTTFAGQAGVIGDYNGIGALAMFYMPMGVALDGAHNLYVADTFNGLIRKITPAGLVSKLTYTFGSGYLDGAAAGARFNYAMGLVVDALGNLLIADAQNNVIRKLTAAGVVSTFAGVGPGSEDGPGRAARFSGPVGVAVEAHGIVYVSDTDNGTIRKILPDGTVSTFAGTVGVGGATNGVGPTASFRCPSGLAVDASNNLYVADRNNSLIRRITPAGTVSTFAGAGGTGFNDGTTATAHFNYPQAVAVDSHGVVYVSDTFSHTIRKVAGGNVTTLAGRPYYYGTSDGSGAAAYFNTPLGLAVDGAGSVYVADSMNHTVRKISPAGVVSTLAGVPRSYGVVDGTGATARFSSPMGLAMDGMENLYVAEGNGTIRKVTRTGIVTTLAGVANTAGYTDGSGPAARFNVPNALAVDQAGTLYIADTQNNLVRRGAEQSPQLFFQDDVGQLVSWVLHPDGSFYGARLMASTGSWKLKTVGDLDGDGLSDLLFQTDAGDIVGWLMHADGTPRRPLSLGHSGTWALKGCGDYDGAGHGQLFFQNPAGTVAYWQCSAALVCTNAVSLGNMGDWKLRALGDLDRDGKAEVFWQNSAGTVAIWFHDGPGGTIRGLTAFTSMGAWQVRGVADMDGDGVSDLAWQDPSGSTAGWFMNTTGSLRATLYWGRLGAWQLKGIGR